KYIKNYGMSIVGVRPANVTGPDKVRGSVDHVQIMTEAARGRPVQLPKKGLMRLLGHVEDMAGIFAPLLLARGPRHSVYNSRGGRPRRARPQRPRVPARCEERLRRGGRARGSGQLPGPPEPAREGMPHRVSRAPPPRARAHQRRTAIGGTPCNISGSRRPAASA